MNYTVVRYFDAKLTIPTRLINGKKFTLKAKRKSCNYLYVKIVLDFVH